MFLAKSIDELYEEVKSKGCDIVICNDAPLALALNNRLDQTRIGIFATTPRQLAGDLAIDILGKGLMDDIEVVKRVSELTGFRLRSVHGEIENIKTMMRYTAEVRQKLSKMSRRVYDEFIEMPTLEKAMSLFDGKASEYFEGKKVAVIGVELFDRLDKAFIPSNCEFIELYIDRQSYGIDVIRELSNDRQIAENVADLIDEGNAKDFAIVFDVGGHIADAVRSALYRKEIPFINSLNVKDLTYIRDFIEFISLSSSFDTVRVSQVRELISVYGGYINSKYDGYLVKQYSEFCEDERTKFILKTMNDIRGMTYGQVCESIAQRKRAAQINILLEELNITEKNVNDSDTSDMVYAVNNIPNLKHNEEIPDSEREGVLLVDCKNSVYVDRPVVVYIGMGQEWEKDLSFLNLIDYRMKDAECDNDVTKFQILLQQGSRRLYVVNAIKNGEKTKPCSYFDLASSRSHEKFADLCNELIPGPWVRTEEPQMIESGEIAPMDYVEKPFSKTSYNCFVSCPRMFMFNVLLGSPDNRSNVVGNILHEYAEFRITYPESALEHDTDYYSDLICEKCEGLFSPEMRSIERTNIRNSITNIDRFIEELGLDKESKIDTNITKNNVDDKRKGYNFFIDNDGKEFGSDITEMSYTSDDKSMSGIFDVILKGHVYDFKTGKPKDVDDILKSMEPEKKPRYLEFQAMFYISMLEEMEKEGKHTFSLFFTNDNLDKNATGTDFDIRSNIRDVELIDDKGYFIKNYLAEDLIRTTKKYMPLENCKDGLVDLILDSIDDGLEVTIDRATGYVMSMTGLTEKKSRDMAEGFVKKIVKQADGEMFSNGDKVFITRKALEDFRSDVRNRCSLAKEWYRTGYPACPIVECKYCNFNDVCTSTQTDGGESDV